VEPSYRLQASLHDIDASTAAWAENEEVSQEQLQDIKAKTMFQMVDDLPDGRKILFLTNRQASLLASSSETVQKMIDTLEIPSPKLIINLLYTLGFQEDCDGARFDAKSKGFEYGGCVFNLAEGSGVACGAVPGRPPFLSTNDEGEVLDKLDRFMAEVIIPLAAETNALIVCAGANQCQLTARLLLMVKIQQAQWGDKLPFTILAIHPQACQIYRNSLLDANWRQLRKSSRAWRQRDKKILDSMNAHYHGDIPFLNMDIVSAPYAIVVDGIDDKKGIPLVQTPGLHLKNEIVRHFASQVPSLTIKTGNSDKAILSDPSNAQSGLFVAIDAMSSGSPVLFLDVRERPPPPPWEKEDRAALLAFFKTKYEEECDAFLAEGLVETFDACAIAHFHDVLIGDADSSKSGVSTKLRNVLLQPLCEAIASAQEDCQAAVNSMMARATSEQLQQTATWLSNRFFQ
jgi:hypothetical protein